MCGRFNIISDPMTKLLMEILEGGHAIELPEIKTQFNVAPTEQVNVLLQTKTGQWQMRQMRWWLVPSWAPAPSSKFSMFNAKSETVSQSKAFRGPFQRQRCIVPVSGYYEWQKQGAVKVPYYVKPASEHGFAFAGLWDRWQKNDEVIESCTIITGAAPDAMKNLHHRVPIQLVGDEIKQWLQPDQSPAMLKDLLDPYMRMNLEVVPISSYVGNSRHKDLRCIEPTGESHLILTPQHQSSVH